jgi:hypothetical protein
MEELQSYRQRLLERLVSIVDDLEKAIAQIPTDALSKPTNPDDWSPRQEVLYLRNVQAHLFLPGLKRMAAGEAMDWGEFDRDKWPGEEHASREPLQAGLSDYQDLCREEARWLEGLPSNAWNRTARHPAWGERALGWWVERGLALAEEALCRIRAVGKPRAT